MLSADEVLTTTRAVRRRLDLRRPVPRELLLECVEIALQAPAGSNEVLIEFVFVTDPEIRARLGEIYAEVYAGYRASAGYIGAREQETTEAQAQQQRSAPGPAAWAPHGRRWRSPASAISRSCSAFPTAPPPSSA
jgi:nitroreductase